MLNYVSDPPSGHVSPPGDSLMVCKMTYDQFFRFCLEQTTHLSARSIFSLIKGLQIRIGRCVGRVSSYCCMSTHCLHTEPLLEMLYF